jgi:hypothetical protein
VSSSTWVRHSLTGTIGPNGSRLDLHIAGVRFSLVLISPDFLRDIIVWYSYTSGSFTKGASYDNVKGMPEWTISDPDVDI